MCPYTVLQKTFLWQNLFWRSEKGKKKKSIVVMAIDALAMLWWRV